ncbi:MAG TPA: hypothetical protein VK207_03035 [Bacteroidales bacterium]|nr:hypothetical protein [Bacteroidales bacterium]
MKKIAYNIFPLPVVILGYIFVFFSFASVLINPSSGQMEFRSDQVAGSATFLIIGLVIVSSRTRLVIPGVNGYIIKESVILWMNFSQEKIIIPGRCTRILICGKMKKGTGYYRYVLPVTYMFKSYDMVFCGELGMTKIMNTDYSRALKVAEFLKDNLKIDYRFDPE